LEKTVQNIPFLRITIALIVGIIIGVNYSVEPQVSFSLLAVVLILLIIFNKKYKFAYNLVFGLGIQFIFIFTGIFVALQFNKKPIFFDNGNFIAVVLETPQEKPNSYKSVIQIEAVNNSDSVLTTKELVIAYFAKNDSAITLKAGDIILFNSVPQIIQNNNNPYEFDYKKYLGQKKVYRQVYLPAENWIKTSHKRKSLSIQAEQIRESLLQIYRNQNIGETEFEILSALTLGYKRELDTETKRIFSASGASHVLAVSGLHVAIVFWVITLLFGLLRNNKSGRIFFVVISISILWFYAFITGMSPSVMRASVMFSIFVIGENLNRKSNIYNSLTASAFILLLINPNNLFDIGFQLSYAAVFGIIFLQPKLENLILVKSRFLKFFWSLITVSIAAQIATFPITTYYFGQFPTYFWITNIIVIPSVMALIPLGILLLFVSKIHVISNVLAVLLNVIIKSIYFLLTFINQLPFAVFEISMGQVQLIFLAATVISVFIFIKNSKVFFIKTTLFFMLFLIFSTLSNNIYQLTQTELIVYNTNKNPGIHLIHGKKNYIITEEKMMEEENYFYLGTNTKRKLGLNPPVFLSLEDSLFNENILTKNGFIFFEGKTLSFNKNLSELNKTNLPDFIINPITNNIKYIDFKSSTIIITNKRFLKNSKSISDNIHNTTLKGAFSKKW